MKRRKWIHSLVLFYFMCPVLTLCVRSSLYVSGPNFMCPIVFCQFLTLCVPFSKKFFFQKCHFRMFLDPLNPNLASVLIFEASVTRYVNFYHENVNFFKISVNVFFTLFCVLNTNLALVYRSGTYLPRYVNIYHVWKNSIFHIFNHEKAKNSNFFDLGNYYNILLTMLYMTIWCYMYSDSVNQKCKKKSYFTQ